MEETLSLSIFALEVDRKPVVALAEKKHAAAAAIIQDEQLRKRLSSVRSGGVPLCDDFSILRLRMARPEERQIFHDRRFGRLPHTGLLFALLLPLDDDAGDSTRPLRI